MAGINKVILVGRLGKDPEVRHIDSGVAVASFTLATSETYTREGQRYEQTEWHNIVLWRGLADIAGKYLNKGSMIYLEGKLRTRSWDDKEGGKHYITEIVGDNMQMLSPKSENRPVSQETDVDLSIPKAQNPPPQFAEPSPDDDLPF